MRSCCQFGSVVCLALLANSATAQVFVDNRASTAAQAYQQGLSDVIRSRGQANLLNSQALGNIEDARSKNMQNKLQWTQTYFEMRKMNRQYREAERGPTPSASAFERWAKDAAPDRLKSVQLDSITGRINWPTLLQQAQYAPLRAQLESDFEQRAERHGAIGPDVALNINSATNQMLQLLEDELQQSRVNNTPLPSYLYIDAKKFIQSLAYEARFPIS